MSFQFFTSSQNGTTAPLGVDRPKARQEEKQTALPVTIRAIEAAVQEAGEELQFFGSQPETLLLVASVETLTRQPNNLDLLVNDCTGRLRVRQYLSGDATADQGGVEAGRYVHLFGQVRTKPELHFVAQGIRPVRSADEVSFHAIEVAHSALRLQRGEEAPPPMLTTPVKSQAAPGADLATPTLTPTKVPQLATTAPLEVVAKPAASAASAAAAAAAAAAAPPATGGHAGGAAAALSGPALREAIMAFLVKEGEAKGDVGMPRSEVCAHFMSSSEAEVSGLLSEMVSDGDAITTIDDDHFAAMP